METYHINFDHLSVDDITREMLIDTVRELDHISLDELESQFFNDEDY